MLSLALSVSSKRNILSRGCTTTIEASFDANPLGTKKEPIPVSAFSEKLLRFLPPSVIHQPITESNNALVDVRGRPGEAIFSKGVKSLHLPSNQEELFFSDCAYFQEERSNDDENSRIDFSFRLNTKFRTFQNKKKIVYDVIPVTTGDIPKIVSDQLTPLSVTRMLPIEVNEIRLGKDIFRPRLFSFLGFAPTIESSVYIEVSKENIAVFLRNNQVEAKHHLGTEDREILNAINEALELFDLYEGFATEVDARL